MSVLALKARSRPELWREVAVCAADQLVNPFKSAQNVSMADKLVLSRRHSENVAARFFSHCASDAF